MRWTGEEAAHASSGLVLVVSTAIGLLGIYLGWLVYVKGTISRDAFASRVPWLVRLLERKYYIDEMYHAVFTAGLRAAARALDAFDTHVVAGAVRLVSGAALWVGRAGIRMQNGQMQTYGLWTVVGLLALILAIAGRRFW